ncbi:MAG: NAD-dependent epimerase/dehydratase family protein [Deltaproteobacteria bacterium]|nr:NAD-dependent epimerase/dehydratase family protein [Deltaproteobacteria bacterium]
MARPVAVTGATGFIGSAVVQRLLRDGRDVRALVEPGAKTAALDEVEQTTGKRVDRVDVDVCDVAAMSAALEGCDALHHLAAVYKTWTPDPTAIYRVNVEGTTATLLAAQKARLRRVVYTSSIAAIGLAEGRALADETTRFDLFDIANEYILTKWLSERVAARFAEGGLPVVIVNPAFPFGPRDTAPTPTGKIVLSLLRGEVPAVGEGGFNCIDVDDVAAGHVVAEEKGRVGERYILGDHNVTMKEFFELVCDVGGVKAPKLQLPNAVGAAIALGFELWSDHVSHEEPRATYKSIRYAQRHAWFDPTKARTELGLPTTPLRTTVARAVDWFRARSMV